MASYGRRILYSDYENITAENLPEVIRGCFSDFQTNQRDIQMLWDIYRGKTDILRKTKEVRENINHRICENRAHEAVDFFTGYTFGEPIQYVHSGECAGKDEPMVKLNRIMSRCGKDAVDGSLADWLFICGVAYRMVLAPNMGSGAQMQPLRIFALDPRDTFVVRSTRVGHDILMAGTCVHNADKRTHTWTCYTADKVFTLHTDMGNAGEVPTPTRDVEESANTLGGIPIFEYEANTARMGVFEPVVDLLNALNELQSNRMDDVVATVNSFLAIIGCELSEDAAAKLQELKMLYLPEGTDAKYLSCQLDQQGMQTLKEDLYQSILTIVGMPNRNGGSSTSDTGSAVILRDGWESAESRALTVEKRFRPSEYAFLRIALGIIRSRVNGLDGLTEEDIEIKFSRKNYANLLSKVQALVTMLGEDKIHPESAYKAAGLFADPVAECQRGLEWSEKQEEKNAKQARESAMPQVQQASAGSDTRGNREGEVQKMLEQN